MSGTSPEVVLGGTVLVGAVELVTEVLVGAVEGGSPLFVQAPVADRATRARTAPAAVPSRFMEPGGVRG
ncbi:MAG: hypothetical protein OSB37_04825 [Acidimicrobiales bacterium]|nr:hypothetical protein [Acidimicrobiales bacterium]